MGRISCLYSSTPFVTERSTLPIQEGTQDTHLWVALFLTWSMWGDQVSRVFRVTQVTSCVDPLDWFPKKCYCSGLVEAPSSTREDYRGALRDINGNSPFTQPTLKIVEVWLQVADEQRRLARRGYDGRVVRVEGQFDGVRGRRHVVDMQTEKNRGDESTLSYPSPHASTRWRGRPEGRFECPTRDVGWDLWTM